MFRWKISSSSLHPSSVLASKSGKPASRRCITGALAWLLPPSAERRTEPSPRLLWVGLPSSHVQPRHGWSPSQSIRLRSGGVTMAHWCLAPGIVRVKPGRPNQIVPSSTGAPPHLPRPPVAFPDAPPHPKTTGGLPSLRLSTPSIRLSSLSPLAPATGCLCG
jgi:hypothetical protein